MCGIKDSSRSVPGLIDLGRNRYEKQAGIAPLHRRREAQRIVRLHPIATCNTVSDACPMEVPAEVIPDLILAL